MNKKILIIGATSGLGRKLAELYFASNDKVAVMGRREYLLQELEKECPGILTAKADITDPIFPEILESLIRKMGGMDMLILTASIGELNKDLIAATELNTASVNVSGFTRVLVAAWHYFKENSGGQIVAVTSIAAARGNKWAPAYNASKAFQSSYLEGLRVKAAFEKNNICITELVPGYIETDMGKGDRMFWVAKVSKAARQSKKAIDKKRKKAFITKRWWWIYRIVKFLPIFIYDRLMNGSWKLKQKK